MRMQISIAQQAPPRGWPILIERSIALRQRKALVWALSLGFLLLMDCGLTRASMAQTAGAGRELDSAVAVVNNQVILASDVDLEMRIYRLLPIGKADDYTPAKALERLTTRALIEQQIVQEDPHGLEIPAKDLEDSLAELRQSLPPCRITDCRNSNVWSTYLATLGLTPARVEEYWRSRMAVLRFIEMRFRSGIQVSPEEIQSYYRETLVPKYLHREDAPPLASLSNRIQEILLQQKVNVLLNDWLKSLQDQGQVEILDAALRAQVGSAPGGVASEGNRPSDTSHEGPNTLGTPAPSVPSPPQAAPSAAPQPPIGVGV